MARDTTVTHQTVGRFPVRVLRIEVLSGPDEGKRYTSDSDAVTLGTAPGNDVLLSDETVSRYHAEVAPTEAGIRVRDLGSRNGTHAGNVLVREAVVPAGSVLAVGRTKVRIDDGGTVDLELYQTDRIGRVRGRTSAMRRLMAKIERAAQSDVPVLLLGETGAGKEVIAQAVHEASPRRNNPFETVDCGSLMPTLIASELFGHEKGAFTGADRQHVGAFERADGGTIFLDEIGELPSSLQPVLLGALERRQFKRVGGTKSISVDVRVVGATNRDLREEVNQGTFRQDLYYRIAVLSLQIPALRERADDIPLLIEHFMREAGFDGAIDTIISDKSMAALKQYRWPGNVRELRNFVEATIAMGEAPPLSETGAPRGDAGGSGDAGSFLSVDIEELVKHPYKTARSTLLDEFEHIYLTRLLERTGGNVASAAREAKMARSYLNEMLRRHRLR